MDLNGLQINMRSDKLYALDEFVDEQDKHRERTAVPTITAHVAQVRNERMKCQSAAAVGRRAHHRGARRPGAALAPASQPAAAPPAASSARPALVACSAHHSQPVTACSRGRID